MRLSCGRSTSTYPRLSARFDHAASQRHHFTMNLHWERDSQPSGEGGTIFDTRAPPPSTTHMSVQLNHKWIRSSTHLNELYLKVGRERFEATVRLPRPRQHLDRRGGRHVPRRQPRPGRRARTDDYLQLVDNYTIHSAEAWKGSHVLKLGLESKVFRSDSFFDSNFRGTSSSRPSTNFLAGRPRRFTEREGDSTLDDAGHHGGPLRPGRLDDQPAADPQPRAALGLRARHRGSADGHPARLAGVRVYRPCGKAGTANSDDYDNVSPRVGFVWDPRGDGRTAVHGGAGLYYDQVILNIQGNARFTAPKVNAIQIENPTFPDPFLGGTRDGHAAERADRRRGPGHAVQRPHQRRREAPARDEPGRGRHVHLEPRLRPGAEPERQHHRPRHAAAAQRRFHQREPVHQRGRVQVPRHDRSSCDGAWPDDSSGACRTRSSRTENNGETLPERHTSSRGSPSAAGAPETRTGGTRSSATRWRSCPGISTSARSWTGAPSARSTSSRAAWTSTATASPGDYPDGLQPQPGARAEPGGGQPLARRVQPRADRGVPGQPEVFQRRHDVAEAGEARRRAGGAAHPRGASTCSTASNYAPPGRQHHLGAVRPAD